MHNIAPEAMYLSNPDSDDEFEEGHEADEEGGKLDDPEYSGSEY